MARARRRMIMAEDFTVRKVSISPENGACGNDPIIGYEEVVAETYYPLKNARDKEARMAYRRSLSEPDTEDDFERAVKADRYFCCRDYESDYLFTAFSCRRSSSGAAHSDP